MVPQGHHLLLVRDRRGPLHHQPDDGRDHPQIITGFQPCFSGVGTGGGTGTCNANLINEGRDQAMEFANGNYGMVESAYDYAMDTTAPSDVDRVLRRADVR